MSKIKNLLFVQRLLAGLIDLIIVYLPLLFLARFLFKSADLASLMNLLVALLFATYNLVAQTSFSGKTVGKYFAKLRLKTTSTSFMEVGQREFAKVLYFLPFVGPIFALISVICYLAKGKFLHDVIGRSEVIVSG